MGPSFLFSGPPGWPGWPGPRGSCQGVVSGLKSRNTVNTVSGDGGLRDGNFAVVSGLKSRNTVTKGRRQATRSRQECRSYGGLESLGEGPRVSGHSPAAARLLQPMQYVALTAQEKCPIRQGLTPPPVVRYTAIVSGERAEPLRPVCGRPGSDRDWWFMQELGGRLWLLNRLCWR